MCIHAYIRLAGLDDSREVFLCRIGLIKVVLDLNKRNTSTKMYLEERDLHGAIVI